MLSRVDHESKQLVRLREVDFAGEGLYEVADLHSLIFENPEITLGEELLMVAKAYSGFDRTREEIDLLAIDRQGNAVVVEVKRDDSGSDVHWQAIKYASYMAVFTGEELAKTYANTHHKSQEEALRDILNFAAGSLDEESPDLNQRQRIILVSHRFRPEVLSAVAWLLKSSRSGSGSGIDIRCISLTPFRDGERLFLSSQLVLPAPFEDQFLIGPLPPPDQRPPAQQSDFDLFKTLLMERLTDLRWYPCWGRAYVNSPLQRSLWIDILVRRRDGVVIVGITTDSAGIASVMDSVYESQLTSKLLAGKRNIECITGRRNKTWRRYETALPFQDFRDIAEPAFIEDAVQLVRDYRAIYDQHIAGKAQG